jgi:hypothetical protein
MAEFTDQSRRVAAAGAGTESPVMTFVRALVPATRLIDGALDAR